MEEKNMTDINEENSTESEGSTESTEPVQPTEPVKPVEPVEPVNRIEPMKKLQGVSEPVKKFLNKPCKMIMPAAIVVVGLLIGLTAVFLNPSILAVNNSNNVNNGAQVSLTIEQAGERAIKFINENMLQGGITASITESAEESGIYKIKLKIEEEEFDSYMTKDGRFLFPQFIDIEEVEKEKQVTKADRPDIKVFVMSYCPYGLQAQKMFLPVYNLLKDEADIEVYYVDYIMHEKEEIDENLRQYCIGQEQENKYYDYLNCFVYGDTGDSAKCMASVGIDKTKLNACVAKVDKEFSITEQYNDKTTWVNEKFPKFGLHTDLNKEYGVKGSPSIIINGKATEISPRSPENFKSIVCESFNIAPEKCSQTLSEEVPSPGFGGGVGNSSGGECK
jgi:glutaredoxin